MASTTKVYTGEWGAFSTSLITNVIILIAILLVFFLLRAMRKNKYLYQPQYFDSTGKGLLQIPELPRSPFGFINTVIHYPSERALQIRGLDSYMFLQVIKTLVIMFLCFLPIGIALLIALDVTADGPNDGIPEIGMSNLSEGSGRLYAHAVVLDLYTVIALYLLYRLYKKYTALRTQWFRNDEAHNYTVMFRRLNPLDLKQTPRQHFFATLFPRNNITGPHYVAEDDFRFEVIKERDLQQKELDRARGAFAQTGVRPMHKPRLFGKKVDTIEHHERVIATCNDMLAQHSTMFARDPSYSRVGFVTYGSIAEAANVVKSPEAAHLKPMPAPQESDIFWHRLNRSTAVTIGKKIITFAIIIALVFLWTIPIIFIQGIANLENLSRISAFSWLSGVNNWSAIPKGLIQQYLPPLFVIIFLALVPKIIAAIMKWRGVATESELSREVFKKYFFFQLWNVFLVSMWAGGVFSVVEQLRDGNAWEVASGLGAGVSAGTLFFINYVLVYTLFKLPLNLLRIGDLIKAYLKRHSAVTEDQKRDVQRPEGFKFDTGYVVVVLLFVICFCYSVLNSFIIPFAIIFFGVEYFIAKYMIIWVYYPKWDSGGLHWPKVFNRIIASMILSQLIIIIVLILRKSESAAVLAPAPIVTLIFAIWVHRKFNPLNRVLNENEYPSSNNGIAFARNYEDPITKDNPMADNLINQGIANANPMPTDAAGNSGLSRRSSLRSSANDLAKARSPALRSSPRLRSPGLRKSGGSVYNELSNEDN